MCHLGDCTQNVRVAFYQQILNNANAQQVSHSVLLLFFHNIN